MWIQTLLRSGKLLILSVALLGVVSCHEADGTERDPDLFPPEDEIDRNYPSPEDAGPDAEMDGTLGDAEVEAGMDAEIEAGTDAQADAVVDSGRDVEIDDAGEQG